MMDAAAIANAFRARLRMARWAEHHQQESQHYMRGRGKEERLEMAEDCRIAAEAIGLRLNPKAWPPRELEPLTPEQEAAFAALEAAMMAFRNSFPFTERSGQREGWWGPGGGVAHVHRLASEIGYRPGMCAQEKALWPR